MALRKKSESDRNSKTQASLFMGEGRIHMVANQEKAQLKLGDKKDPLSEVGQTDEKGESAEKRATNASKEEEKKAFELEFKKISDCRFLLSKHFARGLREQGVDRLTEDKSPGFLIRHETEKSVGGKMKRICGITGTMKRRFCTVEGNQAISDMYSTYKPEKERKKDNQKSIDDKGKKGKVPDSHEKQQQRKPTRKAIDRGNAIHQYVYHLTECVMQKAISDEKRRQTYCEATGGMEMSMSQMPGEVFDCLCKSGLVSQGYPWNGDDIMDGEHFVHFLKKDLQIYPLLSEVLVSWTSAKFATKIDLICLDANYGLNLVSLKTGVLGTISEPGETNLFLRKPWDNVPDSVMNRHDLQLLIELALLTRVYNLNIQRFSTVYVSKSSTSREREEIQMRGINRRWLRWMSVKNIPELLDLIVHKLEAREKKEVDDDDGVTSEYGSDSCYESEGDWYING